MGDSGEPSRGVALSAFRRPLLSFYARSPQDLSRALVTGVCFPEESHLPLAYDFSFPTHEPGYIKKMY